jgi:hypothetical protein
MSATRSALVRRPAALLLAMLLGAACRGSGAGEQQPTPRDRELITFEQLRSQHFNSAYDAVLTLRANWLHTRGTDSFSSPTRVQVYVDGTRYGGVESLRTLPVISINFIRHYDGLTASARWGLDHGQGVIYVSTRPPTERDSLPPAGRAAAPAA